MVELLSPAGEYKSFLGALNAGADAFYLAGKMYGARASAVNFTENEIIDALKLAHLSNRKIYLTVNTLTKENELEDLYDYIRPLYLSGLDSCIVQDMGVFSYLKECFPSLPVHISTQAMVTSKEGALFYKNLGASRVVLARELTLPEIVSINETGVETECFVHGAMCYSYSGACLFSSFLGGNSGNRGRCKGPCRQPYKFYGNEEYLLSLKDMCTIDIVDKLIDAGISSFKIEGRLKSPAYSAGVTSIYRKYIDLYQSGQKYEVTKEDKELLSNLYSRSDSGIGYLDEVKSPKMITFEKGSYNKVSEKDELNINERFIKESSVVPISFEVEASVGKKLKIKAYSSKNPEMFVLAESDTVIDYAKNLPTSKDDIVKHVSKMGATNFYMEHIDVMCDNGFVPTSIINSLRRDVCEALYDKLTSAFERNDDSIRSHFDNKKIETAGESYIRAYADNYNQFEVLLKEDFIDGIIVESSILFDGRFINDCDKTDKKIFVSLPAFLRKINKPYIDKCIEISKKVGIKAFYVNQIDMLLYVSSIYKDAKFSGDTNIYAYNTQSLSFYQKYFDNVSAPVELNFAQIQGLGFKDFEICLYQKAPLMQTANCVNLSKGKCVGKSKNTSYVYLKDRLNFEFPVRLRCNDYLCFNTIYNSKPTSLHKYYQKFKNSGYNRYIIKFTDESVEDTKKVLNFYKNSVFSMKDANPDFDYTNGHIKMCIF